jgi:5-methylcytosine-specific restriction enzyme subunit McrC
MVIPIQNIYYLLSYAWNALEVKEQVNVRAEDHTRMLDLFAKILVNGCRILLKRGIEKNYIEETHDIAGVKGKLETGLTLKSGLLHKQRTICTVDDFSVNILSNRILLTTILRLINSPDVERKLRKELKALLWIFAGAQPVKLSAREFSKVKVNRNNRFYTFLLHVCRIIYDNTLPTEKAGSWRFTDFTRDERQMNKLFEAFLFNFYRKEFPAWRVRSEQLSWQFESSDPDHLSYLPRMITDISIATPSENIIIDAKYYRLALTSHFDREKIISDNLYQIFSYLMNQRTSDPKSWQTRGILLYPTTTRELDLEFRYGSHPIEVKTVNLNDNWSLIEKRLKAIVGR